MNGNTLVVGVTGYLASGKGIVVEILGKEFGFAPFSLSGRVREIAKSRGLVQPMRNELIEIGNETRQDFGGDIFARLTAALAFVSGADRIIIESIRNPREIEFLKQHPNFLLAAVTAPREKRLEWFLARGRESDPRTPEDFAILEKREMGIGEDELGQQVSKCIAMADVILENNGTRDDFTRAIHEFVRQTKARRYSRKESVK